MLGRVIIATKSTTSKPKSAVLHARVLLNDIIAPITPVNQLVLSMLAHHETGILAARAQVSGPNIVSAIHGILQ
jgi:hypothetical protein